MKSDIPFATGSSVIIDAIDTRIVDDTIYDEDSVDVSGNNGKIPSDQDVGLGPTRQYEIKEGSEVSDVQIDHLKYTHHFSRKTNKTFISHGKWIGEVIERNGETFKAQIGEHGERSYSKEVDFLVSEIGYDDRKFIRKGSVFYWSVGYFNGPSGRSRESKVTFRLLPHWTNKEIQRAKEKAKRLRDSINGDI